MLICGELAAAEQAYQVSAEHGGDPQPGLARLWAGRGDTQAAVAAVERCLRVRTVPAQRNRLLPQANDVFLMAGDTERAGALAAELEPLAQQPGCESALAAAVHAYACLELARGDAPAVLLYARKAIQGWDRVGCPYRAARSRLVLGCALRQLGDQGSAHAELQAAADTFRRLGALPEAREAQNQLPVPLPGRYPVGLTEREVQVLQLVAAGRSNRDIAAQLYLSEKTVARHLSNIFAKLDVGSRTAAAAWTFAHHLA